MFRACTASSAAFIAQSYMTRIEMAPSGVKKTTTLATVHEKVEQESDDNKPEVSKNLHSGLKKIIFVS